MTGVIKFIFPFTRGAGRETFIGVQKKHFFTRGTVYIIIGAGKADFGAILTNSGWKLAPLTERTNFFARIISEKIWSETGRAFDWIFCASSTIIITRNAFPR